jgi:cellobiose-specific phosphotransferase system component IIA
MYDYHYNTIKKQYGSKATLCFTDTDSLTYHIKTDDLYKDMEKESHLYDFSEYEKDHPNYDETNKKVIGKFKDETNGRPILEFVGLRSKMYSILLDKEKNKNKATAKGIKKACMKNIKHNDYKRCLLSNSYEDKKQMVSFNLIRSENHIINTINVNKVGLCCYETKRFVLDDNIRTFAHGHYNIRNL